MSHRVTALHKQAWLDDDKPLPDDLLRATVECKPLLGEWSGMNVLLTFDGIDYAARCPLCGRWVSYDPTADRSYEDLPAAG